VRDENLSPEARAFLETMRRRYACKRFDRSPLGPELEGYLLECGRLSPSSFGLEPWRFVAVSDRRLIEGGLYAACFRQEAVGSASLVVAFLARRAAAYEPDSGFVRSRSMRFPGGHPVFRDDYIGYYEFLEREGRLEHWARAQCYIACANMLTGAAAAGLDSCPIEGFDEGLLLGALGEETGEWIAGLAAAFGRRDEEPRKKIRAPLAELSERR